MMTSSGTEGHTSAALCFNARWDFTKKQANAARDPSGRPSPDTTGIASLASGQLWHSSDSHWVPRGMRRSAAWHSSPAQLASSVVSNVSVKVSRSLDEAVLHLFGSHFKRKRVPATQCQPISGILPSRLGMTLPMPSQSTLIAFIVLPVCTRCAHQTSLNDCHSFVRIA